MSSHTISFGKIKPQRATAYGSRTSATKANFPILHGMALYHLMLEKGCFREPHWHPETGELGYVLEGSARMTVKSPDKKAETYSLEPGDIYFIPRAYPHHIKNLCESDLHFLIFFDTPHVQDIGYTGAIPAFPHRLLGPTLQLESSMTSLIRDVPADELIVKKIN